jgi:hypothetical protein
MRIIMRRTIAAIILFAFAHPVHAQTVTRSYYNYLPQMPKILSQTAASDALKIFGDATKASYVDADFNGIDDQRQVQLLRIADAFSPILRRNNFSFPRNFKSVLGKEDVLWVETYSAGKLQRSQTVKLGWSGDRGADAIASDTFMRNVLRDVDPTKPDLRYNIADDYSDRVMFVDYPGFDPKSWRAAYSDAKQDEATIYSHFFIHEDTAAVGAARYYIVLQEWFFYPFDDAANNHEGDWEHMNVLLTSRAAAVGEAAGRMTSPEVTEVLEGSESQVNSLAIAFVDYYFHENVFTLPYLTAYRDSTGSSASGLWIARHSVWRAPMYVQETVRARLGAFDGVLATHPIAYIGGNNKGPDELFSLIPRFGNGYNRNGHGTYAFPGTWQSVGAIASTEEIAGDAVPFLDSARVGRSELAQRIRDPKFISFARKNIVLVPDWERVNGLFESNQGARADWGWLILPMRWGYPVASSPGGGALAHTDVGNISPEGPAFQPTWNRIGSAAGWRQYEPEALSVMLAPTTPWDKLKSGWGILNLPVALFGFLPGWNVVTTQLMPWASAALQTVGAPPARTFRPVNDNLRFSSMTAGINYQFGGGNYALMLPNDSESATVSSRRAQSSNSTGRYGLQVYYGPKLSIENTMAFSKHTITAAYLNEDGDDIGHASGTIKAWNLTSGFRYDITKQPSRDIHLFLRGGWGWTWYTVSNTIANGVARPDVKSGYPPTVLPTRRWWPNSWNTGLGAEYFAPKKSWLLTQVGYGVRAELSAQRHRLGARNPGLQNKGIVSGYEFGLAGVIGW